MERTLCRLLIVNLLLQLFDGVASYKIISAGMPEENPVVASLIAQLGLVGGLLCSKFVGCALIVMIFSLRHKIEVIAAQGLTVLAYFYSCVGVALTMKMLVILT
ncbi:MAG: hypothetical protein QOF64_1464 [Candidatus Binatota bacterium]|jgi:hypothetical protein|nr:hypothetical protein [Candidatus Binatota bacterium]